MAVEVSLATAAFRYFSPATSPFYLVSASGSVALILACNEDMRGHIWYFVLVPICAVLLVSVLIALVSRSPFKAEEADEQLRFARSFGVSSALLCLVYSTLSVDDAELEHLLWTSYSITVAQAIVFVLYTWARSETPEEGDFNFVQLALMTSIFLIGGTYCMVQLGALFEDGGHGSELWKRYLIVVSALYAYWAVCLGYWVRHLHRLIQITIPERTRDSEPIEPPST